MMLKRTLTIASAWLLLGGSFWLAGQAHAAGTDSFYAATLSLQDGKPLALAGLRGQPLVVTFWERDCADCLRQNNELAKLKHKTLGILIDKRAEGMEAASAPLKSPLTTAVTDPRKGLWLMQNLTNPGGNVPFTVVFDAAGKVVLSGQRVIHADEIAAALERR